MLHKMIICFFMGLLLLRASSYCQEAPDASLTDKVSQLPSGLFSKIQQKAAGLERQLTKQTEKYLRQMTRQEERLRDKIRRIDSSSAKYLFANSSLQYAALAQKLRNDSGSRTMSINGEYQPYTDSLRGALSFLQQHPQANLSPKLQTQLQSSVSALQALQAKLQDADQVRQYISQRKTQIGQYISQHANWQSLLGKQYQGLNQGLYYYSQQVRQYKEMLNSPDAMEQKALSLLDQLPAFQTFMKDHSQLAGLFHLPGNYGSAQHLVGLQTRDQVGQLIQNQVSAGGAAGAAALQSNLQSAESQLDSYKDKLAKLGAGSGDIDMPDFKPNDQKTKTFFHRLEYGVNMQTTRNNYMFPTVTDLGLSIGYRLGNSNDCGIGGSFKLGWGNGIRNIAFSGQGAGLRSFVDIKLKGSFFASGGLEYNYETPFTSFQQINHLSYWTKSGLIGASKTVSVKNRMFSKTKLSLFWDFLSYEQIPKTQPVLFRIGYSFN